MLVVLAILLGSAAPVSGYGPVIKAVKAVLTDPDSAKIRNIHKTGPSSYCGWVNAKNGYGGYAGDQLFYDVDGSVQIFDLPAAYDSHDLAEQSARIATGDVDGGLNKKVRLSDAGRKVEACMKGFKGD